MGDRLERLELKLCFVEARLGRLPGRQGVLVVLPRDVVGFLESLGAPVILPGLCQVRLAQLHRRRLLVHLPVELVDPTHGVGQGRLCPMERQPRVGRVQLDQDVALVDELGVVGTYCRYDAGNLRHQGILIAGDIGVRRCRPVTSDEIPMGTVPNRDGGEESRQPAQEQLAVPSPPGSHFGFALSLFGLGLLRHRPFS